MTLEIPLATLEKIVKEYVENGRLKTKSVKFSCDHKKKTLKAVVEVEVTGGAVAGKQG